jgi:sphingomyelin phosphodiesterase D
MSYGYVALPVDFGDYHEKGYNTCTELRKGHETNKFGKVFGWTSLQGQAWFVDKLFMEAGVDGLIYGRPIIHYVSSDATKEAAEDILNWAKNHPETHHVATLADTPW